MTNANLFNAELTAKLDAQAAQARERIAAVLNTAAQLPSFIIDNVFVDDYTLCRAITAADTRAAKSVMQGIESGVWREFLRQHLAHHLILDREHSVIHKYVFSSSNKRDYYNDIRELVPFSYKEALQFHADNLLITPEKRKKWLMDILERTGSDWRKANTCFKAKMTLRGLDVYGARAAEFARCVYSVCLAVGLDFTFDKFYTELRNNRQINGEAFGLIDGLGLTLEWHQNGNTTLRIDKALVSTLNAIIQE